LEIKRPKTSLSRNLMRTLGLTAMVPGFNTSKPGAQGLSLSPSRSYRNQAEPGLGNGYNLLLASRRIHVPDGSHRLVFAEGAGVAAVELDGSSFCVDCLEEALRKYGVPEIFNSEQGSQFTSTDSNLQSR